MKKFLLMLGVALGMAPIAVAQNYFQPGTVWEQSGIVSISKPVATETITLSDYIEVEGEKVMECTEVFNYEDKETVLGPIYIKTDGEKVFWRSPLADTSDWYLMYDFGLKPDEEAIIYEPNINSVYYDPSYSTVKCSGISNDPDNSDLKIMTLLENYKEGADEEYNDDSQGEWIIGVGCKFGVLRPIHFDWIPNNFRIDRVTLANGDIVYQTKYATVSKVLDSTVTITANGLYISVGGINSDTQVEVFTLDGTLIGKSTGNSLLEVPEHGTYVVKAGEQIAKILL